MSWKPRTIFLTAAGAALVAGLAWVSFRDDPIPVDLHTIGRAPLEITVNADGVTRIRDVYDIASPITGTALRSPVAVGDAVVAGETLVASVRPVASGLLDSRSLAQAQATVQEAEASVQVAHADLDRARDDQALAQSQYDRTQVLVERGVSSLTQLEVAAQHLAVANAAVASADARIAMAESTLARARTMVATPADASAAVTTCCLTILAPADGVVLSVAETSERPVTTGTPLLSIGDPADLEIVADVLSSDALRLAPGAHAAVERWGGPQPLAAELARIAPSAETRVSALGIEEQRLDVTFDITSPPEDRAGLGHGFAVYLRITEWRSDDSLQVPLSAIFKRGEDWHVFVADGGIATERAVALGRRNDQMAEVLSGLAEGDTVVMHPNDALVDGLAIVPRAGVEE